MIQTIVFKKPNHYHNIFSYIVNNLKINISQVTVSPNGLSSLLKRVT
jgi:hypothetical protein